MRLMRRFTLPDLTHEAEEQQIVSRRDSLDFYPDEEVLLMRRHCTSINGRRGGQSHIHSWELLLRLTWDPFCRPQAQAGITLSVNLKQMHWHAAQCRAHRAHPIHRPT
jgi:hypothetical protein